MNESQRVGLLNVADMIRSHTGEFNMGHWQRCAIGTARELMPQLMSVGAWEPEYQGECSYDAVALYFGIHLDDARFLFDFESYTLQENATREEVADRILDFAKSD